MLSVACIRGTLFFFLYFVIHFEVLSILIMYVKSMAKPENGTAGDLIGRSDVRV